MSFRQTMCICVRTESPIDLTSQPGLPLSPTAPPQNCLGLIKLPPSLLLTPAAPSRRRLRLPRTLALVAGVCVGRRSGLSAHVEPRVDLFEHRSLSVSADGTTRGGVEGKGHCTFPHRRGEPLERFIFTFSDMTAAGWMVFQRGSAGQVLNGVAVVSGGERADLGVG